MNARYARLLKPDISKIALFATLLAVISLGAAAFAKMDAPRPPYASWIEEILKLADWWQISLVVGLPGNAIVYLIRALGVKSVPGWAAILIYGTTSYLVACYFVELVKAVRASYAKRGR